MADFLSPRLAYPVRIAAILGVERRRTDRPDLLLLGCEQDDRIGFEYHATFQRPTEIASISSGGLESRLPLLLVLRLAELLKPLLDPESGPLPFNASDLPGQIPSP